MKEKSLIPSIARPRALIIRIISLFIFSFFLFTFTVHAEQNRTVKAGYFAFPGYHQMDKGVRSGYGYDFLKMLQQYTQLDVEFVGYDHSWEEMQQLLVDGKIDLVTSARKTPEREKHFDFSKPIGINYAQINVRKNDKRFVSGDFTSLNGITIGLLSGNSRNADTEAFAHEKGFSYKIREFRSVEALQHALADGSVDAIATSSLRKTRAEKTIAEFAPQEFYVIVRKGDSELLDKINYGIDQMDANEGNWRYNLYFNNYDVSFESLTLAQYLKLHPQYAFLIEIALALVILLVAVLVIKGKLKAAQMEHDRLHAEERHLHDFGDMLNAGTWSIEVCGENEIVGVVWSDEFRRMLGFESETEFPNVIDSWKERLHSEDRARVDEHFKMSIRNRTEGLVFDIAFRVRIKNGEYRWYHAYGRTELKSDGNRRLYGVMADISAEKKVEEQRKLLIDANRHEKLKADAFDFMMKNEDLEAFVEFFSSRILELYGCDQVIYRDVENRMIIKEKPGTPKLDFSLCKDCPHFAFDAPVYAGGFTAMDDCRVGYNGIPVHSECHVRASLTYLVYEEQKVFGYIALHYLDGTHRFTDKEKNTFDRVAKFMSMVLSRRKKRGQLKQSLAFTNYLVESFVSSYSVNLKTHSCSVYKRTEKLSADYPDVSDYLVNIAEYIARDVHSDDRAALTEFVQPDNLRGLLKKQRMVAHAFRDISGGVEKSYRMRVVRGADEDNVVFAFVDLTEETKKEVERKKQLEEALAIARAEQRKTDTIHEIIHSGKWSFSVNANDEVTSAYYSEFVQKVIDNDLPADVGYAWADIVHPDDREAAVAAFRATIADHECKTPYDVNYRMKDRRGKYNWFHSAGRIIRNPDGTGEFFGIHIDITDQVEEQKKRLLGAIPLSPDVLSKSNIGLWSFELDEGQPPRMYVDNTMLKLVGLDHQVTPEETYHAWYDHIDKNSYGLVHDAVAKMSAGEHAEVQYPWHHPDGHTMIVRCGGIRNNGYTKGIRIEGTHQDVSETLHFDDEERKALVESNARFFALEDNFESLYDVNLETGDYDVFMKGHTFSEKVSTRFVEKKEFFGDSYKNIDTVAYPEDKDGFKKAINPDNIKMVLSKDSHFDYYYRLLVDDKPVWFRMRIVYKDNAKKNIIIGIFNAEKDLETQQLQEAFGKLRDQQQQLQEALSMAQSANRAKTTFLNNMSHDIRTPMNAIIGFTGLAASHIDNKEQVQDYLTKIGQSSDHLLSLINDVLDMSRIESGKMNLDEKEENLPAIIHTLRDIVQADIRAKQHDFFIDTVNVNDENVICDKLRLNQVLLNILSNAIKYTANGGTISMRITEKAVKPSGYATYEFCIKDNGMGMDSEFQKTIFDPFTRVKSSTVSGIQGTGLGMAITKNIIDMMGGTIDIQSSPGKGTQMMVTFDFRLLAAHREMAAIPELNGLRGLVVDDDADTCMSITSMLRDIGMRGEWCVFGKEAIIRASEAHRIGDNFKVYIIDWLMPDMNGIETTRRIRKVIGDDAPIIILTAYDWSDIEDEAREAGVTAFVSKPMFPSDLHRVLNRCLGKTEEIVQSKNDDFDFTGKKVLLVEDNELNREIATEILEENGFQVDIAEDGNIAVEKVKRESEEVQMESASTPSNSSNLSNPSNLPYDLILMDIQMPTMDGYEATKRIRAWEVKRKNEKGISEDLANSQPITLNSRLSTLNSQPSTLNPQLSTGRIPIIAMTANAFEEDRKLAIEAGMDDHVTKPIDVRKLKETLAKFI